MALLLAPLAASFGLSWQAWALSRQYRAAVANALDLQAGGMVANYRLRIEGLLWTITEVAFRQPRDEPALRGPALLDALDEAIRSIPDCRCAPVVQAEALFWEDLATGERSARAVDAYAPPFDSSLLDPVRARYRGLMIGAPAYAVAVLPHEQTPRFLIYGFRLQGKSAPQLFGFVITPESLGARVFDRAQSAIALPAVELGPDSSRWPYLSIRSLDRNGRPLWQSVPQYESEFGAERPLWDDFEDLRVALTLNPETVGAVIPGGLPRSPLPLLATVVLGSVLFTGLGLLLLRRADQLQRLQQELTARITHELRTPLTQILLYGESLHLNRLASPERRQHAVLIILREARHLIHLIDNALIFARAGRSAVGLAPERQAIAPLVDEVIDAMSPLLGARDTIFEGQLDRSVLAEVDATALRQVVRNLVDNALRHGRRGQTLRIVLAARGDAAELTVDDEGPGIEPEERGRVLDPFVRLSPHGTGSGLGLAIVKHLVELMRGEIALEDAPGGGCRVRVTLPLSPTTTTESLPERRSP